jgi:hypothetical protein
MQKQKATMIQIFEYKSTGKKHEEENRFFQFIVKSRFSEQGNRSLQWCKFEGLKIIVDTLEPSIIDFVKLILKDSVETNTGYKYELV